MNHPVSDSALPGKPAPLRVLFILNGMMAILPFVFFTVFKTRDIEIDGVNPEYMLYTGVGYVVTFAALVYFILQRRIVGVKFVILLNILIALPAKAYIGIAVAIVSVTLTFNRRVKDYFLVT